MKWMFTEPKLSVEPKYWMGGGGVPDAPTAPAPPPPPPPIPKKEDEDVEQEKKEALEKKIFRKGREKSILSQTGEQGSVGKKTLLGQ